MTPPSPPQKSIAKLLDDAVEELRIMNASNSMVAEELHELHIVLELVGLQGVIQLYVGGDDRSAEVEALRMRVLGHPRG